MGKKRRRGKGKEEAPLFDPLFTKSFNRYWKPIVISAVIVTNDENGR